MRLRNFNYFSLIPTFLSILFLVIGCAQSPSSISSNNNPLTSGQVSLTLKKNSTTQTEVLEKFGSPNTVSMNADGEEVWSYQKHATISTSSSSSAYGTVILLGAQTSSSGLEQSSRTMTLVIKFKEINGVKTVVDFSSRASSF